MSKKKKIFGIIGAVFQLCAILAGFFPFIYRIEEYIYDPAAGDFIFEKTAQKYSLFFDPGKLGITEAAAEIPGKGGAFFFAILFTAFGLAAVVLAILSIIRNKNSKLPLIGSVCGIVSLILSAVGVLTFNYQLMTWLYSGFVSAGMLIVLLCQLLALVFCAITGRKKE